MTNNFSCLEETNLDSNNIDTVTNSLDIRGNQYISFDIKASGDSQSNSNHIITLQCSLDGSTWYNTNTTITGTGLVSNIQMTCQYVRLKITTIEGSDSTIDININAK